MPEAALVSLIAVFLNYCDLEKLNYNLILLASAEEEISGKNGVESVLEDLGKIDFGIIGEPTGYANGNSRERPDGFGLPC